MHEPVCIVGDKCPDSVEKGVPMVGTGEGGKDNTIYNLYTDLRSALKVFCVPRAQMWA